MMSNTFGRTLGQAGGQNFANGMYTVPPSMITTMRSMTMAQKPSSRQSGAAAGGGRMSGSSHAVPKHVQKVTLSEMADIAFTKASQKLTQTATQVVESYPKATDCHEAARLAAQVALEAAIGQAESISHNTAHLLNSFYPLPALSYPVVLAVALHVFQVQSGVPADISQALTPFTTCSPTVLLLQIPLPPVFQSLAHPEVEEIEQSLFALTGDTGALSRLLASRRARVRQSNTWESSLAGNCLLSGRKKPSYMQPKSVISTAKAESEISYSPRLPSIGTARGQPKTQTDDANSVVPVLQLSSAEEERVREEQASLAKISQRSDIRPEVIDFTARQLADQMMAMTDGVSLKSPHQSTNMVRRDINDSVRQLIISYMRLLPALPRGDFSRLTFIQLFARLKSAIIPNLSLHQLNNYAVQVYNKVLGPTAPAESPVPGFMLYRAIFDFADELTTENEGEDVESILTKLLESITVVPLHCEDRYLVPVGSVKVLTLTKSPHSLKVPFQDVQEDVQRAVRLRHHFTADGRIHAGPPRSGQQAQDETAGTGGQGAQADAPFTLSVTARQERTENCFMLTHLPPITAKPGSWVRYSAMGHTIDVGSLLSPMTTMRQMTGRVTNRDPLSPVREAMSSARGAEMQYTMRSRSSSLSQSQSPKIEQKKDRFKRQIRLRKGVDPSLVPQTLKECSDDGLTDGYSSCYDSDSDEPVQSTGGARSTGTAKSLLGKNLCAFSAALLIPTAELIEEVKSMPLTSIPPPLTLEADTDSDAQVQMLNAAMSTDAAMAAAHRKLKEALYKRCTQYNQSRLLLSPHEPDMDRHTTMTTFMPATQEVVLSQIEVPHAVQNLGHTEPQGPVPLPHVEMSEIHRYQPHNGQFSPEMSMTSTGFFMNSMLSDTKMTRGPQMSMASRTSLRDTRDSIASSTYGMTRQHRRSSFGLSAHKSITGIMSRTARTSRTQTASKGTGLGQHPGVFNMEVLRAGSGLICNSSSFNQEQWDHFQAQLVHLKELAGNDSFLYHKVSHGKDRPAFILSARYGGTELMTVGDDEESSPSEENQGLSVPKRTRTRSRSRARRQSVHREPIRRNSVESLASVRLNCDRE